MAVTIAIINEHSFSAWKLLGRAEQRVLHARMPDLGVGLELDICALGQCCATDCHQAALLNQQILHHLQRPNKYFPPGAKMMCTCMVLQAALPAD